MLKRLKNTYEQIAEGKPGHRFTNFYKKQRARVKKSWWNKILYPIIGCFLIVIGALLSIPPGVPGFVVVIVGLAMLAVRSRHFARILDWCELKIRNYLGAEQA
jgi:hypothetical protein